MGRIGRAAVGAAGRAVLLIGSDGARGLPMDGALPPDLEGTLFRVGPVSWSSPPGPAGPAAAGAERGRAGAGAATAEGGAQPEGGGGTRGQDEGAGPQGPGSLPRGALHAVELRDGRAVSYLRRASDADAGVFWHAGALVALPEVGIPLQYSRALEPEEFRGGLTVPIASHTRRVSSDGSRVLFAVDDGLSGDAGGGAHDPHGRDGAFLRIGEWDAGGRLRTAQSVELERATWQHDLAVTEGHVAFIESPTVRLRTGPGATAAVPFGWVPGAEGWLGLVPRAGDGTDVRWVRLDPCLVTHVLGAWEEGASARNGDESTLVLHVCRYDAPEAGRPIDLDASVVGPTGVGFSPIADGLAVLERWQVTGDVLERVQIDERRVEYPTMDPRCAGAPFRYGYGVEMSWADDRHGAAPLPDRPQRVPAATPVGLLKFDLRRDATAAWSPGPSRAPSEAVFVRSPEGRSDDEGWLLTVVDDTDRGASDLFVLDASELGRRHLRPEAVIHLPERLPRPSHGEWVPADRYR